MEKEVKIEIFEQRDYISPIRKTNESVLFEKSTQCNSYNDANSRFTVEKLKSSAKC